MSKWLFRSACLGLALIALATASQAQSDSNTRQTDLTNLAAAERAFAAETVKLGFRDGFIKFFADDGIGFGPHPERTREKLMKSPPATGPRKMIFNWAPMFGDISAAGDMGYTTGPVIYTDVSEDPKPPRHGMYFSVWQKQTDGTWKVVVDMGVDTQTAVAPIDTKFTASQLGPRDRVPKPPAMGADGMGGLDTVLSEFIREHGMAKAYANLLERREFRVHRKGQMPIISEKELVPVLRVSDSFEFIGGGISASNDLGFSYGKYFSARGGTESETGYYVHVWRRDVDLKWRLVVDVQNPLPKSEK